METTKRFPRTMEEAFPKNYREHFNPIQAYKPRHVPADWIVGMVCMFALGFLAGLILGAGL
jgi:hypothetical protein